MSASIANVARRTLPCACHPHRRNYRYHMNLRHTRLREKARATPRRGRLTTLLLPRLHRATHTPRTAMTSSSPKAANAGRSHTPLLPDDALSVRNGAFVTSDVHDVQVEVPGLGVVAVVGFMQERQTEGALFWQVSCDVYRDYDEAAILNLARQHARKATGWALHHIGAR